MDKAILARSPAWGNLRLLKALVVGSAVAWSLFAGVAHATLFEATLSTFARNIRVDGVLFLSGTGSVVVVMTTNTDTRVETPVCGFACPEAISQDFDLVSISLIGFIAPLQGGFRAMQFRTSTGVAEFGTIFSYGGWVAGGPLGTYQRPITNGTYGLDPSSLLSSRTSTALLADGRTISFTICPLQFCSDSAEPVLPSSLTYLALPEPSTCALLGLGLLGLAAGGRRRRWARPKERYAS